MEMRIANFNRSYYSGMNPDTLERVPNRQAAKNNLNRLSDGLRGAEVHVYAPRHCRRLPELSRRTQSVECFQCWFGSEWCELNCRNHDLDCA